MNLKSWLVTFVLFVPILSNAGMTENSTQREVTTLKAKIIEIKTKDQAKLAEKYYRHRLAIQQAALVKKDLVLFLIEYYRDMGSRKNFHNISAMVDVAFESSFIFTSLGVDYEERFLRILQWAKIETDFNKNTISNWKAGQYIKSLNTTIRRDTSDHGTWQINRDNLKYVKRLNYLYNSGVISYKIKNVRTIDDLMDINTNCAARCFIETERKKMNMPWKHDKAPAFVKLLRKRLVKLETSGLYDKTLIAHYYHLNNTKTYP